MKEEEVLKLKLQQALKAAANADAELREKGLLQNTITTTISTATTTTITNNQNQKSNIASVADQIKRVHAIEEINSPNFTQHSFVSGHSTTKSEKSDNNGDIHTAAMFGLSVYHPLSTEIPVSNTGMNKSMRDVWKNDPEKLAHENLFEDLEVKTERWKKKLIALRRKKINTEQLKTM